MGIFMALDQIAENNLIDMHGANNIVKFWKDKNSGPNGGRLSLSSVMFLMLTKL
jgi:hypothetical protein